MVQVSSTQLVALVAITTMAAVTGLYYQTHQEMPYQFPKGYCQACLNLAPEFSFSHPDSFSASYNILSMEQSNNQILQFCCNQHRRTIDGKYELPDGVELIYYEQCYKEPQTSIIETFEQYQELRQEDVDAIDTPNIVPGMFDVDYRNDQKLIQGQPHFIMAETTQKCEKKKIQVFDYSKIQISEQFKSELLKLPLDIDSKENLIHYIKFLSRYGTHYLVGQTYGGKLYQKLFVQKDFLEEQSSSVILTEQAIKIFQNKAFSTEHTLDHLFEKYSQQFEMRQTGGKPLQKGKYDQWKKSLDKESTILSSKLDKITRLISKDTLPEIDEPIISTYRTLIATVMNKHIQKKGCTNIGAVNFSTYATIDDGSCQFKEFQDFIPKCQPCSKVVPFLKEKQSIGKGVNLVTLEETKDSIFEYCCNLQNKFGEHDLPDGIKIQQNTECKSNNYKTTVMYNVDDLDKEFSQKTNVQSLGSYSSVVPGSQSTEYLNQKKAMEKDDMSITETYLRCELESTSLENEMNVRVSNQFKMDARALPLEYNEYTQSLYTNFIRKYGTHYRTANIFGGILSQKIFTINKFLSSFSTFELQNIVQNFFGQNLNKDSKYQPKSQPSFWDNSQIFDIKSQGGMSVDGKSITAQIWIDSILLLKQKSLINQSIKDISYLFTRKLIPGLQNAKIIQGNIQVALSNFLLKKGCTNSRAVNYDSTATQDYFNDGLCQYQTYIPYSKECTVCNNLPPILKQTDALGATINLLTLQASPSIIKYCCNSGRTTLDGEYQLPDAISYVPDVDCSLLPYTYLSKQAQNYQDLISFNVRGAGQYSSLTGILTEGYQQVKSAIEKSNFYLQETEMKCKLYKSTVQDYSLIQFTDDFIKSVQDLPLQYDQNSYAQFFEKYGSHMRVEQDFGGKISQQVYSYASMLDSYNLFSARVQAQMQLFNSLNYNFMDKQAEDPNFEKYTQKMGIQIQGGSLQDPESFSLKDYIESVRQQPDLIGQRIMDITNVFTMIPGLQNASQIQENARIGLSAFLQRGGCTNAAAQNWSKKATVEDGSCQNVSVNFYTPKCQKCKNMPNQLKGTDGIGVTVNLLTLAPQPSIFDYCCNRQLTTLDGENNLPDGVGYVRNNKCDFRLSTFISKTFEQYTKTLSVGVEVKGEYKNQEEGWGITGGLTVGYKSTKMAMKDHSYSHLETKGTCSVYKVTKIGKMQLSEDFKQIVLDLERTRNFNAFYTKFGTHYRTSSQLGGQISQEVFIKTDHIQNKDTSSLNFAMNIAFTSKVFNGSIDPKAESNNESLKDISTYGHFLNFEQQGGEQQKPGEIDPGAWMKSVPKNAVPIKQYLEPLSDLFTTEYIPNLPNADSFRAAAVGGLSDYLQSTMNENISVIIDT